MNFNYPEHIAIIMDGNGRWAKRRKFVRTRGHEEGVRVVKEIILCCCNLGVSYLTLYAFSTENWKRPKVEIKNLMNILLKFLRIEKNFFLNNNIRLKIIGQLDKLPLNIRKSLKTISDITISNSTMQLNLALSYGGRDEIRDMVIDIANDVKLEKIQLREINSKLISKNLYTKNVPDPDLLIRTGGEVRISNFLLWQIAYTELFFTNTLWPDFNQKEFIQIINEFSKRNRRFGSLLDID